MFILGPHKTVELQDQKSKTVLNFCFWGTGVKAFMELVLDFRLTSLFSQIAGQSLEQR